MVKSLTNQTIEFKENFESTLYSCRIRNKEFWNTSEKSKKLITDIENSGCMGRVGIVPWLPPFLFTKFRAGIIFIWTTNISVKTNKASEVQNAIIESVLEFTTIKRDQITILKFCLGNENPVYTQLDKRWRTYTREKRKVKGRVYTKKIYKSTRERPNVGNIQEELQDSCK